MSLDQWMPVQTENFHSARDRTQPYKVRGAFQKPLCAKRNKKRPSQWRPRSLYSQAQQPTCTVTQRVTPLFPLFPFASRAEPISIAPLLSADASKSRPNTILVLRMCLYFWRHSVAQSLSHILITVMCMQRLTCFVHVHVFAQVHPTMSCIPLVLVLTLAKSTCTS